MFLLRSLRHVRALATLSYATLSYATLSYATPVAAQTRVACVGDSITEGYGLSSPNVEAYPAQLQMALGDEYVVNNFGVSGSTARKQGDKPYWDQAAYAHSTDFAPAIVLLMLGTNDTKSVNWDESSFESDYAELVEHYLGLNARVIVAAPPKVFATGAFDIDPAVANDVMVPLLRDLANERQLPLVDAFEVTADHAEWFPDNVHPTRDGAAAIAQAFAEGVRSLDAQVTSDAGSSTSTADQTDSTPSSSTSDADQSAHSDQSASTGQTTAADPNPGSSSSSTGSLSQPEPSTAPETTPAHDTLDATSTSDLSSTSSGSSTSSRTDNAVTESTQPLGSSATGPTSTPHRTSGCGLYGRARTAPSWPWIVAFVGLGWSAAGRRARR